MGLANGIRAGSIDREAHVFDSDDTPASPATSKKSSWPSPS